MTMISGAALKAQPDVGAQDAGLVLVGVRAMLDGVLMDMRSEEEGRRAQALSALTGMARKSKPGSGGLPALQDCFREADGFGALVTIMSDGGGPFRQEPALAANAVDALLLLTKNNAKARAASVAAGAVDSLVNLIGAGDEAPVSINVLRGLYQLLAAGDGLEAKAGVHSAVLKAGGLRALIRLLDTVLLRAAEPDCSTWGREVAAILFELVRSNPSISGQLCDAGVVGSTIKILSICEDPLAMSLGLDILEEVVNSEDRGGIRDAMMSEGAVPALLRIMHVKGIGSKAALALAFLGEDPGYLPVIVPVMDTDDVACMCHIAALAADADDLDAGACIEFIQLLLEGRPLPILRHLVAARCIGVCLALAPLHGALLRIFSDPLTGPSTAMLLDNSTTYGRLEGALAGVELLLAGLQAQETKGQSTRALPYFQRTASLLRRNGKLEALVSIMLDEALADDKDEDADNEVSSLLSDLLAYLPEQHNDMSIPSQSGVSAARSPPKQPGGAGFSPADVNARRYDSITFLVGGREFYALGWVLEQASARLKRLLTHMDDCKAPLPVPAVEGLSKERMYEMFSLAVEFAYTGWLEVAPTAALDLWALAACLEMDELQSHCERVVMGELVPTAATLEPALELAYKYRTGNRLRDLCCLFILHNLGPMASDGRLAHLIRSNRPKLEEGLIRALGNLFSDAAIRWAG